MRITVNSKVLEYEIRLLNNVITTKSVLPILSHILFRAEDALYLSATDLNVAMTTTCAATVTEMGAVTLPAKRLLDLLTQLPEGDIQISVEKNQVRLTVGAFTTRLAMFNPQDFPQIPVAIGAVSSLPAQDMRLIVERTMFAIGKDASQYVLKGSLLSVRETVFAMVATDGKRLSVATASCQNGQVRTVIVPLKTLEALLAFCFGTDILFSTDEKHLFFVNGHRLLVSQMLEGQFPKYERIIPKNNELRALIDRIKLADALRRVGVVSGESQAVNFIMTDGHLDLVASTAGIGDAIEGMDAQYTGPELKITVNGSYVLDFLDRAGQQLVTIDLKDNLSPMLFTDGQDFINVVMVMRS